MPLKNSYILLFSLLFIGTIAYTPQRTLKKKESNPIPPIVLPSKEILHVRLANIGLNNFLQNTNIIQMLANQVISPENILEIVDHGINEYCALPENSWSSTIIQMRQPEIIATILYDKPRAIQYLQEIGLLPLEISIARH